MYRVIWTDKQIAQEADRFPRTRRELVYYLWFALDLHHVNIFKEGPEYSCRIGRAVHATYLRTIDSLTFGQWADRINKQYFPF